MSTKMIFNDPGTSHRRRVVSISSTGIDIQYQYQRISKFDDDYEKCEFEADWTNDPESGASLSFDELRAITESAWLEGVHQTQTPYTGIVNIIGKWTEDDEI